MKVLVVATSKKTRGGITSIIVEYEHTSLWKNWNCKWIQTHRDSSLLVKLYYFVKSLLQYILIVKQYDIIHIHLSEPISALRKKFFVYIASKLNKKIILHLNAFSHETTFIKKSRLYRRLFEKADAIILVSTQWKNWLNSSLPGFEDKIKVIYNPAKRVELLNAVVKEKEILFAGTVNGRKGYKDLINAFALIATNHPDWKIVFAGNGEIETAKELAKRLNINKQTIFPGWVSGKRKEVLFNSASIFCLPSYAEGFPLAVLDAWAYGLPVITTPVGGLPDVLKHGENALVFEPGNVNQLAENLELLIKNKDLRDKLSKSSLELSNTIFNIQTIEKQLDNLYTNIISGK